MNAWPPGLGERLREARLGRGLKQTEAAALMGVDEKTIHNWETGKATPRMRLRRAITSFLGYDLHREDLPGERRPEEK